MPSKTKPARADAPGAQPVDPAVIAAPDKSYEIAANEYGFYAIPPEFKDRAVPRRLQAGQVYEADTLKLIGRLLGTGDIVTGGAFIGDFLPALSGMLAPGALLHTFEPNPISHLASLHTIGLNRLNNVCLHPVAVGREAGNLPLQVSRGSETSVMAERAKIVEEAAEGRTIEVEIAKIDDLVPEDRRVSVLHLDIEGQEENALMGAQRIVKEQRPVIILEAAKLRVRKRYARMLGTHFAEAQYRLSGFMERNGIYLPMARG